MPERAPDAGHSHPALERLPFWACVITGLVIVVVTLTSLWFFYTRGLNNLYGDAMAHMEGARRIFDSLTPGYEEIGTVWLPLFHILVAPLAINDFLWRTGLGGGLVSSAAFALSAWFLFRLAHEMSRSGAAAVVAVVGFISCPNMLYLASSPLTEPLAVLWMVLMVYGIFHYQRGGSLGALMGAAVAAFCGTLTRYDGWFQLPFAALFVLAACRDSWQTRLRHALLFSLIAGAGPFLWLLHNFHRYGNALEFYNGPLSTQAQYAHQLATTAFRYPTDGSLVIAARYYLTDLELVIGVWPLALAMLGLVVWAVDRRERARRSAALLLLVPFIFYVQGTAHAAVPLYVPTLFPYTYYNLRFGAEMLPGVAIFTSFLLSPSLPRRPRSVVMAVVVGVFLAQAFALASAGPAELVVAKEGVMNTPCRSLRQQAVTRVLRDNYDGQTILMAGGQWPCVMTKVGISFRSTLTEANRKYWRNMRAEPEKRVKWIVRSDGDAVDTLMRAYPRAFESFALIFQEKYSGEGGVAIYRRRER